MASKRHRRGRFGRRSLAPHLIVAVAALALLTGTPAPADARTAVTIEDLSVTTADRTAEAVFAYPADDELRPAVILWSDTVGVRPMFRAPARKPAAEGYVVLLPNTLYRGMRPSDAEIDPRAPANRPALMKHRAEAVAGIVEDIRAYVSFLDARGETEDDVRIAAVGFDLAASYAALAASYAVLAAAQMPERIVAVASLYGLGVAITRPDSPHLLIPQTRAGYYLAIARDDDAREPGDKVELRDLLASSGLPGTVELIDAEHGWANPAHSNYDRAATDRTFEALISLLRGKLN